jgi:type III restriction enzyme
VELKNYQQKVLDDLSLFLEYVQKHRKTDVAFNTYWTERIGPYNPIDRTGMPPYKNHVANAVHVCMKVPTAGGKTFIACNALRTIYDSFDARMPKMVIWLVPWSNLLDQTYDTLNNPDHPYRQRLNALFNNRVEVYRKQDVESGANFSPDSVKDQLSIIVMSFASLRAKNKEARKAYQENGNLMGFAQQYEERDFLLDDVDDSALMNVIRSMKPVVVLDESHNAESDLSVEMLNNLNPSFILDLTATPKQNSNIVSLVPAIELKKDHMVKLPVIVYNHHDKTEVIQSALHLRAKLEQAAIKQRQNGGRYIRPIVLFQAQSNTGDDKTTFEKLKKQLLLCNIPEDEIKIKTANINELKGVDLSSEDCKVRYIITINALKEGWDCPFAYVLASLADKSSAVDVEQILGRVLRQPYVQKHPELMLNMSYVLTASTKFKETLQSIVNGLQEAGFSDKDYRERDMMPEAVKQKEADAPLQDFFFPEQQSEESQEEIDPERIQFNPSTALTETTTATTVTEIEDMAEKQLKQMEAEIAKEKEEGMDEGLFIELDNKVKRYSIHESNKELIKKVRLPRFYLETPSGLIFDTGDVPLDRENLLQHFKLSLEDTKIDFDQVSSDLYKVDIEEAKKDEYTPRFTKIEDLRVKDPVIDYILSRPLEKQVVNIVDQLILHIGNLHPIADQEIRQYVERIMKPLNTEQLMDVLARRMSYAQKIKEKISQLADKYAEGMFNDWVDVGSIKAKPEWKFPSSIVPGMLGPSISNSLYEREGAMNNLEVSFITDISGLPNIAFWHRNLGRGKGFSINGFKSNHYPDFIVMTRSGKTILVETKGDHLDNEDSAAKNRLGRRWAELAGPNFKYFMVFEKKEVRDAYTISKAKELISKL